VSTLPLVAEAASLIEHQSFRKPKVGRVTAPAGFGSSWTSGFIGTVRQKDGGSMADPTWLL
jgi:hypothetical protein